MKIKGILNYFKATRTTYLGITGKDKRKFQSIYQELLKHKECDIPEYWWKKAVAKLQNSKVDYLGKINGMKILTKNKLK